MKTVVDIMEVLAQIECPGFDFVVRSSAGVLYLQVESPDGTCNVTGEPLRWRGRKWLLSLHMTDGEIVQTAFKALLTALEHEVREQFKYKDVSVFDPHYDIDRLVELRRSEDSVVEREPG